MSHTITYNPKAQIIETKTQGGINLKESEEIISEVLQAIRKHNCFFILSDYRESTLDLSTLEIYDIPKRVSAKTTLSGISEHKLKRAIIAERESENFRFFETVTLNSGQQIKLFDNSDEAKKWLLEK